MKEEYCKEAYYIVAKTNNKDKRQWLPLVYHMQDTMGVMNYLICRWLPLGVFQEIGIEKAECKKIGAFLALVHDIGKATPVFQNRIIGNNQELRDKIIAKLGIDIPQIFSCENKTYHGHAGATLLRSMNCPDDITYIVGSHHGKPESSDDVDDYQSDFSLYHSNYGKNNQIWDNVQRYIFRFALEKSGYESIKALPEKIIQKAQMILTGLLIMADWIASNQHYFPLMHIDDEESDYDISRVKNALDDLDLPEPCYILDHWRQKDYFIERFGFEANPVQSKLCEIAENIQNPGLVILEAPMGCGKTEASLAMAEILMNKFDLGGIGFFLPSQATSNAMFGRIESFLNAQPDIDKTTIQLAHAHADLNEDFAKIIEGYAQTDIDSFDSSLIAHSFFQGRKTKLLANIVVGTVDQLLMAALKQKHVMLRHLGLVGKVVIIDECHAYDAYMNVYLDRVLMWLATYGVPVILLSATLPGYRRKQLLEAYAGKKACANENIANNIAYPLISYTDGSQIAQVNVELVSSNRNIEIIKKNEEEIMSSIEETIGAGGCVGIILNTVKRVQKFYDIIKEKFPHANIYVDHSQFLVPDRVKREEEILKCIGKKSTPESRKNVIVIGSQVLEQSLDIDFDLLITDLCPMDLLMQRIGRLHRHDRVRPEMLRKAMCIVLGADENELEKGSQYIYGKYLLKKTIKCLPGEVIIPEDISVLVHMVYDENNEIDDIREDYEEYEREEENSIKNGKAFCIDMPCNDRYSSDILGILEADTSFTEQKARTAVRDGISSIEIILLKETNGKAQIIPQKSLLDTDRVPSTNDGKLIASQRIKLPSIFSRPWNINKVLEFLEKKTNEVVPEWVNSSWLVGEIIIFIDENNEFILDYQVNDTKYKYIIHYDINKGLSYKEDV